MHDDGEFFRSTLESRLQAQVVGEILKGCSPHYSFYHQLLQF